MPADRRIVAANLVDGFRAHGDVVLADATSVTRIGRCAIAGRLVLRRCPQLTEIAPDLITHGLVIEGATRLQRLPERLRIDGDLRLTGCPQLEALPEDLEVVGSLAIRGCPRLRSLPRRLVVGKRLCLVGKTRLAALPATLAVGSDIILKRSVRQLEPGFTAPASLVIIACDELEALPAGLSVGGDLIIRRCPKLTRLPSGLRVGGLEARHAAFESLPEGIRVGTGHIDLEGCSQLTDLPEQLVVPGRLRLRRCVRLARLPGGLTIGRPVPDRRPGHPGATPLTSAWPSSIPTHLDLMDCPLITALPEDLAIRGPIEVAGTGITGVPQALAGVPLRWRGVTVSARVAFHPQSFNGEEVLAEPNVEVRRVMMERIGAERLIELLQPTTIDEDTDPGGPRRLLRVQVSGGELFVFLDCRCPSTGRRYLLRTAPHVWTCRAAAAWLAGFDDPDDYQPIVET